MKLHGLQKMTLLDFPGHVACTVFLGGCDFRCPFCHNYDLASGSARPVMDEDAFFTFLKKRKGLLDGVAVTGGEPCLHGDLPDLLRRIRALGFRTKVDTNGYHPDMLQYIIEEKLVDYVAMNIKNSPAKYAATTGFGYFPADEAFRGTELWHTEESSAQRSPADTQAAQRFPADTRSIQRSPSDTHASPINSAKAYSMPVHITRKPDLGRIHESISLLIHSPIDCEFRTTVVKEFHSAEDFYEIGEMIRGADKYFLQCFTDRDTVPFGDLHAPSYEELRRYWKIMLGFVPGTELRGVNEPA